jgi:hypothetical protein
MEIGGILEKKVNGDEDLCTKERGIHSRMNKIK